jgi:hypothetical protein
LDPLTGFTGGGELVEGGTGPPSVRSRLEESEWLAPHISYYRLSSKCTGEDIVVRLRRAT